MSEHIIRAEEYREDPAYKQLLDKHHLETYIEYAGILKQMSQAAYEMQNIDVADKDDVEKNNLKTLVNLLHVCSDLFRDCDPYYRR